jgi:hypothetical protein
MHRILLSALVATLTSATLAHAQQPRGGETSASSDTLSQAKIRERLDSIGKRVTTVEQDVDKLKPLKVSGYVQAEWQHFDQSSSAGGRAVPGYFDTRKNFFTIRRGEVKFQYRSGDITATLLPDITESGVVIREAFGELKLLDDIADGVGLAFRAGMFNRPNPEAELSSSMRESPERAQITRAFYPGDRDLGLMFTLSPLISREFEPTLRLAIFNGPGAPNREIDPYKDIMAHLALPIPLGSKSPLRARLGLTYYYGGIPQTGDSIIRTIGDVNTVVANDATGDLAGWGNNSNFGIDGEFSLDLLPIGGTVIKGEFLAGSRATGGTAATPATAGIGKDTAGSQIVTVIPGTAATPLQIRNQSGFFAYLIQNFSTWGQLVLKYDMFDRNTDMSGAMVHSANDAATSVLGFGLNFFYQNMRLTAYYEIPGFASGEVPDKAGSSSDVKDNKTTVRFQFKF